MASTAAPPDEDARASIVRRVAYLYEPSDDEDEADAEQGVVAAPAPASRRRSTGGRQQSRKHGRSIDHASRRPAKKPRKGADVAMEDGHGHGHGMGDSDGDNFSSDALAAFPTLLCGREPAAAVSCRRRLFSATWSRLEQRMQGVLHRANGATLTAITEFIGRPIGIKLPVAFVVLGPAASADILLFQQLAASLSDSSGSTATMVRLRAADAPNLRSALRMIVQGVTAAVAATDDNGDDLEETVAQDGRKYLAFDLEAVCAVLRKRAGGQASRVVVTLEDSEAFDGSLLADLLSYLHLWIDRIPFVVLFGVAASVDLLQARLPKAAAHRLAAAQFDAAPSGTVFDQLVRCVVAVPLEPEAGVVDASLLRMGPLLLRSLADRQADQIAGAADFISSLQYAYMSYFYGNPLSVLLSSLDRDDSQSSVQGHSSFLANPDYLTAIRQLPSFRAHVEALLDDGEERGDDEDERVQRQSGNTAEAKLLLTSDVHLRDAVLAQLRARRRAAIGLLRSLHLAMASGAFNGQLFTDLYLEVLEGERNGGGGTENTVVSKLVEAIRRMSAPELIALARNRLVPAVLRGDLELGLAAVEEDDGENGGGGYDSSSTDDSDDKLWRALLPKLRGLAERIEDLQREFDAKYNSRRHVTAGPGAGPALQLRSKYTAQSRVLRTTVVAQKVQLSRDAAAMSEEDETFTGLVDAVVAAVTAAVTRESGRTRRSGRPAWLQEVWQYDGRMLCREVFVPRPGQVLERALSRPHDYLACQCCAPAAERRDGRSSDTTVVSTLPTTAILFRLYQEAGPLVNVADLWTAFLAIVHPDRQKNDDEATDAPDQEKEDESERRHLMAFYEGLAELEMLGFVKPTRKKVDHVAKVKWL